MAVHQNAPRRRRLKASYRRALALAITAVVSLLVTPIAAWGAAGSSWTAVSPAPAPSPTSHSALADITCLTDKWCFAVGGAWGRAGEPRTALLQAWNGRNWRNLPVPFPSANHDLSAVSCSGPAFCMTVGSISPRTDENNRRGLVAIWDGSGWRRVPAPPISGVTFLGPVECPARNFCLVAGEEQVGYRFEPRVFAWNGTWRALPAINHRVLRVYDAHCVSTTDCFLSSWGPNGAVVARWRNDKWQFMDIPNSQRVDAVGISCTSATSCLLVGDRATDQIFNGGAVPRPWSQRWDGRAWTEVPAPRGGSTGGQLFAVDCIRESRCIAVGVTSNEKNYVPYVAIWDGAKWMATTPQLNKRRTDFDAVSCVSGFCAAIGLDGSSMPTRSVAAISR